MRHQRPRTPPCDPAGPPASTSPLLLPAHAFTAAVASAVGIGIAGLVADARSLSKYMRTECINHRFVYDAPMQVGRLVLQVADKAQIGTQRIGRRPYGVGLLIVGSDQTGPHLFEVQPSGQYYEYKGMAIGARSQAGRTYLERHFEDFAEVRPRPPQSSLSLPPLPARSPCPLSLPPPALPPSSCRHASPRAPLALPARLATCLLRELRRARVCNAL